jgi:nitrite reductase/ring-hydroxylating ferredoxin subunit
MKTKIAELSVLEDGKAHCVKANGVSLLLVKSNGIVHAIENKCPHLGLPLGRGKIDGGAITCPFHGSRFNLETGENSDWVSAIAGMQLPKWSSALLSFGKKPQPVRVFAVSIENENVFVTV